VNLAPKGERQGQSHDIAQRYGARLEVAEVPPGSQVLQTLVAEV